MRKASYKVLRPLAAAAVALQAAVTPSCPPALPQECHLERWARHSRPHADSDRSRGKTMATVVGWQVLDVVVKAVTKVAQTLRKIPRTQPLLRLVRQLRSIHIWYIG